MERVVDSCFDVRGEGEDEHLDQGPHRSRLVEMVAVQSVHSVHSVHVCYKMPRSYAKVSSFFLQELYDDLSNSALPDRTVA